MFLPSVYLMTLSNKRILTDTPDFKKACLIIWNELSWEEKI